MATDLTGFGPDTARPSPEQEAALELNIDRGMRDRLMSVQPPGPSVRQQTQSEILSMVTLMGQLGNPFSTRRIPFSVMRDMAEDPMLAFALFYIVTPLIRADWVYDSPDAQLAAAADAAFRPTMSDRIVKYCNILRYGYQPGVKGFKLGQLAGTYRDPQSDDPEADLPVWPSENVQAILPDVTTILAPENCLPRWDEHGEFDGFFYSQFPIPNPMVVGTTGTYVTDNLTGWHIPREFALWPVNEREQNFGSIYGSPRTKRAYRYYWSYWFRWALADRSFENKADPAKIVYFPTGSDDVIDPNDPHLGTGTTPTVSAIRNVALALGNQARSGATLAIPGDFIVNNDGKLTANRKWEIKYLEGGEHFDLLDKTFQHLDVLKVRAMFIPEQALLEGRGGSSSRNVAAQLGEVYQESQQLIADEFDQYHTENELDQWVAANFPEKYGTPIRKVTSGLGALDAEMIRQIITLVGQVRGNILPIDIYKLLEREGFPMLTKQQQDAQIKQIVELQAKLGPPETAPRKVGTQGYNAGVMRTETGETTYYTPPQRIVLAESSGFLASLPDIPPYRQPEMRSSLMKLRKMMLARYRDQLGSFKNFIADRTTLKLAQTKAQKSQQVNPPPSQTQVANVPQQQPNSGLVADAAVAVAATLVTAWLADQVVDAATDAVQLADVLATMVKAGGTAELAAAKLDPSVYDYALAAQEWTSQRVDFALSSIDQTVRDELKTFLAEELTKTTDPEQVAADLDEHFAGMPETHVERVVRAEARDAYNFGMLRAGIDAGIDQCQAHDASEGANKDTDAKCRERNGKVFSLQDALQETEHPNGTLYFTFLSTENLSLELVDDFPEHLEAPEGQHAIYDDRTETLYVAEVAAENSSRYLLALGDQLSL